MLLLSGLAMLVAVVTFVYLYSGAEHMQQHDFFPGGNRSDEGD